METSITRSSLQIRHERHIQRRISPELFVSDLQFYAFFSNAFAKICDAFAVFLTKGLSMDGDFRAGFTIFHYEFAVVRQVQFFGSEQMKYEDLLTLAMKLAQQFEATLLFEKI